LAIKNIATFTKVSSPSFFMAWGVFREVEGRDLTHILIHPRVALSGCPRETGGDFLEQPRRFSRGMMFSCEGKEKKKEEKREKGKGK